MIRIKIRKEIDRKKYLLFAILSFVIVLAAWLIASESGAIKEIFLPKPQNVVNYYIESIKDGSLLQNTGISIYRITLGFVYAVLLGVPIGILVGTFKKAEAFIRPLCEFVRYMPVPAFVPLIMVWVGIEESAKITVIFIGTFFQLVLMVADDALAVPDDLINAGYTLGSNTPKTIFKILIPVCKPIIAVLALWSFVGMWNSYFDAMIYLNDANLQPLQLVLRSILVQNTPQPGMIADIQSTAEMAKVAEQLKYATIVVSSLPLLVMYPFFQKYFDKGIMVGSVKG